MTAREAFELHAQAGERITALAFQPLHLGFGLFKRGAQRRHHLLDRGLTLFQAALRDDVLATQGFARELQEDLTVGPQAL